MTSVLDILWVPSYLELHNVLLVTCKMWNLHKMCESIQYSHPPVLPVIIINPSMNRWKQHQHITLVAEPAERSPIIIQNSSNPSSWKNLDVQQYNCTTIQPTVQGATFSMHSQLHHGYYLIISPLHRHGEVANENPLILPCTLSIVGALVLLKRCAGKRKCKLCF